MGYFQPLVIYRDENAERKNSILRYVGNRVLRANKNFLCLSGETILLGQKKTLKELYNRGETNLRTYSLTKFKKGDGGYYPIKSNSKLFYTGKKEVFEIELINGKKILVTSEHRLFKKERFTFKECKVKDLKVGDSIRDFPKEYVERFYKGARKRSEDKRQKTYNPKRLCEKCGRLFFISKYSGCKSKKYCNRCSELLNRHYQEKRKRKDCWSEWEKNILKIYYFNGEKEFILNLLPHREWNGICHKASRLNIKRKKELMFEKNLFTSENNPMNDPKIRAKVMKKLSRLFNKLEMSSIEKKVAKVLIKNGIKFDYNTLLKTKKSFRFPDFKIDNLIIECDGDYWHRDRKEEDLKRQREIEEMGFEVIRFTGREINKNLGEVEKCILQKLNQLKV